MLKSASLAVLAIIVATGCSSDKPEVVNETLKAKGIAGYDPNSANAANLEGLKFVSPTAETTSSGKVKVQIDAKHVSESATWSLFYSNKKGGIESGVAIVTDIPVTTTEVTWDTEFVNPGTYYLFALLKEEGATSVFPSEVAITISGENDGNRSPFIIIRQEIGDRVYKPGDAVNVAFTGSDPDQDDLTYKIEYSADEGKTWKKVVDNLNQDTLQYAWTIPDVPRGAQYQVRVVGDDGRGRTGFAMMEKPFGITEVPVTYDDDIQQVLADNCTKCHTGATPPGNFDATVFTDPGNNIQGAMGKRGQIYNRTRVGADKPMPPDGKLSQAARDLIALWRFNNFSQAQPAPAQ